MKLLLIILVAAASLHAVYATFLDEAWSNQDEALNHHEDHDYPSFLRSSGVYPHHRLLREGEGVIDRIRRDDRQMKILKNAEEGGDISPPTDIHDLGVSASLPFRNLATDPSPQPSAKPSFVPTFFLGVARTAGEEGGEGELLTIQNQLYTQQMADRHSRYDMFELEDAATSNTWVGPQSGTSGKNWYSITSDSYGNNLAAGSYNYGILLSIYLFIVICVYFLNPCYSFIAFI